MLPLVLRPLRAKHDQASLKINFVPAQSTYLFTPLTSEDQQPNDVSELIITQRTPNLG